MSKVIRFIQSIINACPYSIAGKKCLQAIKGNKIDKKGNNHKILRYKKGIKTGANILLIGVFCPFLWYSILAGQSKDLICLNVLHSGIIAGIGVLIVVINYLSMVYYRKQSTH
ncbi:hypothetical protein R9C00_12080 [Flammeovirgaceae bacterium SG7u.111]|nr:hypothetical protein [Flammeovirgaceae bacterium SG7u.132]WPO38191.1 hypothetical protein R9C00_12080 [Flammeovirgaceae bacterium SG7u.111]